MIVNPHKITRKDCYLIIQKLLKAFRDTGLESVISFLVYGAYLGKWRNGLSDLDGIIYFPNRGPLDKDLRPAITEFQARIRQVYKESNALRYGHFFADIFVIDEFHGKDGRFMIFDRDFKVFDEKEVARRGSQTYRKLLCGRNFISHLRLLSLRSSTEQELALGLHKLRNYLFFEIPRQFSDDLFVQTAEVIKFLKILPRAITIILDEPIEKQPRNLSSVRGYLSHIDYEPLVRLWRQASEYEALLEVIRNWHRPGNEDFIKCLECYEQTLQAIVTHEPMRGVA